MKNPFEVSKTWNEKMKRFDVCLLVGGFETAEEADHCAKLLAEFMAEDGGWLEKIRADH